jgi:hypothetical protein
LNHPPRCANNPALRYPCVSVRIKEMDAVTK